MSMILECVSYVYEQGTAYESVALREVSFSVGEGEFIGVIGHTGSGKSSLMQMLNALERPTSGKIMYNGQDIWGEGFDRRQLRKKVGMVFQYPEHQLFETTVLRDVMFGPRNMGYSKEEAERLAKKALEQVGLEEEWHQYSPFELSGGQKRRVAIAGVLAMQPEVLILDEPTAGLDPAGRYEILEMLGGLRKEYDEKITVLLVSHSMEDVARYVDRILVMDDGSLKYDDKPEHVFAHVKELEDMGLAVPVVTYLLQELKQEGWCVDTNAYTIEQAADTIVRALQMKE